MEWSGDRRSVTDTKARAEAKTNPHWTRARKAFRVANIQLPHMNKQMCVRECVFNLSNYTNCNSAARPRQAQRLQL